MSQPICEWYTECMENTSLPKVASSVLLVCKKCERERYHRVIAHTSETSAKVACEVCGSKKTFKLAPPPGVQERKSMKKSSKGRSKQPQVSHHEVYIEMKEKFSGKEVKPYDMKKYFEVESSINHPKFGLGFVIKTNPDKIEVMFEDSFKNLVHNRTA